MNGAWCGALVGCLPLVGLWTSGCSGGDSTPAGISGGSAGESNAGTSGGGTASDGGSSGSSGGGVAGAGGGSVAGDGGTASGAAGSAGGAGEVGPSRPKGTIPNDPQPETKLNLPRDEWQSGLISPTLESEHHNQPAVVNGYLQLNGNARFSTYDVSDPTQPVKISEAVSPDDCAACGPNGGEAEGHQVSFARYGDQLLTVTISGRGVDTWNITNPEEPAHLDSVHLEGIDYGDFTDAVWGVYWQGSTIYVGGTNTGLHVLDASDPADVKVVQRVPTSQFGNVSAGPLYAVGNVLVITTPKESGGVATLDISDPYGPFVLDAISTGKSYIGAFYRHHVYLQTPLRVWDVLTDPTTIGSPDAPLGTLSTPSSEYMSFSDGYMFLGLLRPDPGAAKIDVTDPTNMRVESRIWGRMNLDGNDDQFTVAIGNLLVMSDDQLQGNGGGYVGTVIGVHAAQPDTTPPVVDTIIPRDGATGVSVKSRIGVSFTDNVELATVSPYSFVLRPVGGQPVPGKWGLYMGVLNFDPDQDLEPQTQYEVVLREGGLTDYVGNALAEDFTSSFTTR